MDSQKSMAKINGNISICFINFNYQKKTLAEQGLDNLPAGFYNAGDFSLTCKFSECNPGDAEFTHISAGTTS